MSNEAPTDAPRLVPVEPTEAMVADGVKAAQRAEQTCVSWPEMVSFTYRAMLSAAPASPLQRGGPTCQLCASKIEGWICQGCGSHFYENDAGALVLSTIPAAPTGDA